MSAAPTLTAIIEEARAGMLKHEGLATLIKIASLAIEIEEMERLARIEQADLSTAYRDHKARTGHAGIKRGSLEWGEMLMATAAEYGAVVNAKRKVGNAKRRLKTAIRRYGNHA